VSRTRKLLPLALLVIAILVQMYSPAAVGSFMTSIGGGNQLGQSTQTNPEGNGYPTVGPGEVLHKFVLTDQGWVEWTGLSAPLTGGEYGNSSNSFPGLAVRHYATNVTTGTNANVSTGTGWEAYKVSAAITSLTENRTWFKNPDFKTAPGASNWTLGVTNVGGSSTPTSVYNASGHGTGNGAVDLEIDSTGGPTIFYYDQGDFAWIRQTVTIPRGTVVWAGLILDYWAETRDNTHYGMTGSFSLYVNVEGITVWETVFDEIDAERTWYSSGMSFVSASTFNLPTDQAVSIEVGLWSKQSVGYTPEIGPHAKIDNVELYMKTRATPTNVNLKMNGVAVTDGSGYGSGTITQVPSTTWKTNPVKLNFTWLPAPVNPSPNRTIVVEFDVATNMFARRLNTLTVSDINPTAYGQKFSIQNGSAAYYSTYFYADIPTGYPNRYFFNESLPTNRDVYFVAAPLAPSTNLTTGWSGGQPGNGYLNVSAYRVATEAGRYGYWRILSQSPNMITNIQMYNPSDATWKTTVNLRAGNITRVRAFVGASFAGSVVNVTIYNPAGQKWYSVNATANATGYATTRSFTFAGTNSTAGSWMIQAMANDVGSSGKWTSTGFFKRAFSVTHASKITILYPSDAISTWTTNVTYRDLLLIVMKANDTDSSVPVAGGTLALTWTLGTITFDDSGNGQYAKVVDTSPLTHSGRYAMQLKWTRSSFDNATATLYVNVNYAATLQSPQYPGISGPIGFSQSFTESFKNVNGTGITNAVITCNWSKPYQVTSLGLGSYRITLNTTGYTLGQYPVLVRATAPYVNPQTMVMFVEVRNVYNSIAYSANQLSIPVGESAYFNLTWTDENNNPISGWNNSISANWTSFHTKGEKNYTVLEVSAGVYKVTLFTESDDPLTAPGKYYTVVFNVARYHYQNHTFTMGVQIRNHNTLFVLDEPLGQTPYGQRIVMLVFFEDTDLGVGISNASGYVRIVVTSPGVSGFKYTIGTSTLGLGHYNITAFARQWGTIGWKNLTITVSWTGPVAKYYGKTIDTAVRVLGTDTDLYLELAPSATYYLENLSFTTVYWDAANGTRISNSTKHVFLRITPLTGGHSVTQAQFKVFELTGTPGVYSFGLNSSLFGRCGTFVFQLDFMWNSGVSPLYENRTMTVTLIVLQRSTYVDPTPIQSTPYAESAVFTFSYFDTLTTTRIPNSSQLNVRLNEGSVSYVMSYNSGQRVFTMTIDTKTLGGVGIHTLHLNLTWTGVPFYAAVGDKAFVVIVILRSSQLTHQSFTPPQYANNVTIEFVYTDLVSGSSAAMTGTLMLNSSLSGHYTVIPLGNGHYRLILDTSAFASDGQFVLNATIVYTGSNYVSNAADFVSLSVLKRTTQFGYETPDPTAYLENVTFTVTYSDDTTGVGILAASVSLTCSNTSETLALNTNYWVASLGQGTYQIKIKSSSLGSIGVYSIGVTVSRAGSPFYMPATRNVNSRVTQRATQILMVQTPGETPFRENVTFRFRYIDFITGANIAITKTDITLILGGSYVVSSSNYKLTNFGSYYEIRFNSTLLDSVNLVTGRSVKLTINRNSSVPYYAAKSSTTYATTIERPTQILFPLVQETPYFDNLTMNFDYTDYITGAGISGANITLSSANLTSPVYIVIEIGGGSYRILVPTQQFGGTGTVFFTLTANKTGAPYHYASRTTSNVPAVIRLIQTSLLYEVPPAGTRPVGDPMMVNLTLSDLDHSSRLAGAVITCDWSTRYNRSCIIAEIGGGAYRITLNTTGLVAQPYTFTIRAQKTFYQTTTINVIVQPGSATVVISLGKTVYYADWGQHVLIRFDVRETLYFTLVPHMNGTLLWNGTVYQFSDLGNGTYSLNLDTSAADYGYHEPQVSVSRIYYQTRTQSFALIVSRAAGQIMPSQSIYAIVTGTTGSFWVYLNDTENNRPVIADSVTIDWKNQTYALVYNGTPGFFVATVNVSGLAIGQYPATLRAFETNHVFLDYVVDINVAPVPTHLQLAGNAISVTVVYGITLGILVTYNDTYHGGMISGANITYVLGNLTGSFTQLPNGTYRALIGTSSLTAQTLYLRVTAAKQGYATATRTVIANIMPRPTQLTANPLIRDGYYSDIVSFVVYYNDSLTGVSIAGAAVSAGWEGGLTNVTDLHNGSYMIVLQLTLTNPRLYELNVALGKTNYASATISVNLLIKPTPAEITGRSSLSVPVNDTASVLFTVTNSLSGQVVTGINGISYWSGIGEIPLTEIGNGSYRLDITGGLPIGFYQVEIVFATSIYQIEPLAFDLTVRQVLTELRIANTTISTVPGGVVVLSVTYYDLDHGVGISGVVPLVATTAGNVTYFADMTNEPAGNGTYLLYFGINGGGTFQATIQFSRGQYATKTQMITFRSDISAQQVFFQRLSVIGGAALILAAALVGIYVRVWSVPRLVRALNRMIAALAHGKIPRPPVVKSRNDTVLNIVNGELKRVGLQKQLEDIAAEPIVIVVPEVNDLLQQLASITGLGPQEVEAFRSDLARMKPSERPGFLREVITQEQARRAEALAEKAGEKVSVKPEKEILGARPGELQELRMKLQKKGMAPEEVEIIVEQAKSLSKADLQALLDSLGISLG